MFECGAYVPMYVETVPNRNSPPAIHLREGWRENGKVKKHTLANLTKRPPQKIEALRRVLRNEPLVGREDAFDIQRFLPHGHVGAVLGTLRKLRLDRTIAGADLRALYPRRRTSQPGQRHKIYPYLLRDLSIERANQAWACDICYIPMAKGFM